MKFEQSDLQKFKYPVGCHRPSGFEMIDTLPTRTGYRGNTRGQEYHPT